MEEYIYDNCEFIRQEVENICVLELERIKNLAGQGVQPYKRLWEIRERVMGE